MRRIEDTDVPERLPVAELRRVFEGRPVRLVVCFGSQATGRTHPGSDVDLAIEFEDLRPGDESYNDVFFELYGAIEESLGTTDFDLLDVHSISGPLARTVLTDGILVYGTQDRLETLRERIDFETDRRPPRERLDETIDRIDEHLA